MKRMIIEIDEQKCNGCGLCTEVCAEAALTLVDGKAKVVRDFLCDGMGACLDVCPVDALHIVEKESEEYDPKRAHAHVAEERGDAAAQKVHGFEQGKPEPEASMKCGCPGSMMRDLRGPGTPVAAPAIQVASGTALRQWPIQLHLLQPHAPYFQNSDLLVCADCVPFAFSNFHARFLSGKVLIMFCPKLDQDQESYVEKISQIFTLNTIRSVAIVHMEVPCCGGVERIVQSGIQRSGRSVTLKDYTISIQGEII